MSSTLYHLSQLLFFSIGALILFSLLKENKHPIQAQLEVKPSQHPKK